MAGFKGQCQCGHRAHKHTPEGCDSCNCHEFVPMGMRSGGSSGQISRSVPRDYSSRTLVSALRKGYWHEYKRTSVNNLPLHREPIGPRLADGEFVAREVITRPLAAFRPRPKFSFYRKEEYELDILLLERARARLRQEYLDSANGLTPVGLPVMDGIKFKRVDDMLLAELESCDRRRKACVAIVISSKANAKLEDKLEEQSTGKWLRLENDAQARAFRFSGHPVRVIETGRKTHYEVKL